MFGKKRRDDQDSETPGYSARLQQVMDSVGATSMEDLKEKLRMQGGDGTIVIGGGDHTDVKEMLSGHGASQADIETGMRKIADLRDKGALSDEQYETLMSKLRKAQGSSF